VDNLWISAYFLEVFPTFSTKQVAIVLAYSQKMWITHISCQKYAIKRARCGEVRTIKVECGQWRNVYVLPKGGYPDNYTLIHNFCG
jgi:hypothetical protein